MSETRIYSEKRDINSDNTKFFYDSRARAVESMSNPYVSVLLGDQFADRAEKWDRYEKDFVLPMLAVSKDDNVLDIGCGIGRWAETLIPICGHYTGIDLSSCMIDVAKKRCVFDNCDYRFINASFTDIADGNIRFDRKFSKVIDAGVFMYINDDVLAKGLDVLSDNLTDKCVVYFEDTACFSTRLTLDGVYSESLKSNYNAIYRTPDEYMEIYSVLLRKGFVLEHKDFFPDFEGGQGSSETSPHFFVFKRG